MPAHTVLTHTGGHGTHLSTHRASHQQLSPLCPGCGHAHEFKFTGPPHSVKAMVLVHARSHVYCAPCVPTWPVRPGPQVRMKPGVLLGPVSRSHPFCPCPAATSWALTPPGSCSQGPYGIQQTRPARPWVPITVTVLGCLHSANILRTSFILRA